MNPPAYTLGRAHCVQEVVTKRRDRVREQKRCYVNRIRICSYMKQRGLGRGWEVKFQGKELLNESVL